MVSAVTIGAYAALTLGGVCGLLVRALREKSATSTAYDAEFVSNSIKTKYKIR